MEKLDCEAFTAGIAYHGKEQLRRVRRAETIQAAKWRATTFLSHARDVVDGESLSPPVAKALRGRLRVTRAASCSAGARHTNARIEGLNGLFQAARARTTATSPASWP